MASLGVVPLAILAVLLYPPHLVQSHDLKGFDDTVLFNLAWHSNDELLTGTAESEEIFVTTANKEKYRCVIPSVVSNEKANEVEYNGPSPIELLTPLFLLPTCSYRIESYWTYEVCHGSHIKQYHEERQEKSIKLQEYFLGRWDKEKTVALKESSAKVVADGENVQYKKIEGLNLPYLEIEMNSGTICDLNGEPRVTKVLYVCYILGKNEIYSLKETSTCNYEAIILTPALCTHPKYKPQDSEENMINCTPFQGAPRKPRALLEMEVEKMKLMYQQLSDTFAVPENANLKSKDKREPIPLSWPPNIPDDAWQSRDTIPKDVLDAFEKMHGKTEQKSERENEENTKPLEQRADKQKMILKFLKGDICLIQGSGWWMFEFCYGKYVRQFHQDTTIFLGFFDKQSHMKWLEKNPAVHSKRKNENQISHFYSNGEVCDKTNQPRQVEVKLKCTDYAGTTHPIALYLLEPRPCEYILNVESSLLCGILPQALDNMLLPDGLLKQDKGIPLTPDNNNEDN